MSIGPAGVPTGPYTAFLSLMGGPTEIVTPSVYERIVTAVDTQASPGEYYAPDVGLFGGLGFANPSNCCISITQADSNRGAALVRVRNNKNTAIGVQSLLNSIGTKNIGIGYRAGMTLQTGNNNIYVGNQGAGDESQTIRIGTAQAKTFIAGINAASVGDAQVMVDTTTGQLGIVTSSARYKQDIETMASRSEGLLKLRPVTFVYKDDKSAAPRYGLIAEEVATVYPELVTRTATGEVQTVKYHELIPMLLNELQRQRQEFQQALQSQRKELAELRSLVGSRQGE